MLKISQQGIASLFLLLFILAGVGLGVYLIQRRTNPLPQASTPENISISKPSLVFSIDQGWGNGIIEQQDLVGLKRIADSLKTLKEKYQVFALLTPVNKDKDKIKNVLDLLAENKIPFYLDVLTSDAHSIGRLPFNNAPDPFHGVVVSFDDLKEYKSLYGKNFAGIRFMEVFSMDQQLKDCKRTSPRPSWCPEDISNFPANFYEPDILEKYLSFAKENNLNALWVSPFWAGAIGYPQLESYEADLKRLIAKYPETMIVIFADNTVSDSDLENPGGRNWWLKNWYDVISKFQSGAKGLGMSAQAWNCQDYGPKTAWQCDFNEFIRWVNSAKERGVQVIQFEPDWYFWQFPVGVIAEVSPAVYERDGGFTGLDFKYQVRGVQTEVFNKLKEALLTDKTRAQVVVKDIKVETLCEGEKPKIKISWVNPAQVAYHKILRKDQTDSVYKDRGWTDGSKATVAAEFIDDAIGPGAKYIYGIKTFYPGGSSNDADLPQVNSSSIISAFCEVSGSFGPPEDVSSLALSCTNNQSPIKITWNNKPFTLFSKIERTSDNSTWKLVGYTDGAIKPASSEYIDYTAVGDTYYAYRVFAAGDEGHRGYSKPTVQTNSSWPKAEKCSGLR